MILPLFGGLSDNRNHERAARPPKVEGPELVQETFPHHEPPGDLPRRGRNSYGWIAAHVPCEIDRVI